MMHMLVAHRRSSWFMVRVGGNFAVSDWEGASRDNVTIIH